MDLREYLYRNRIQQTDFAKKVGVAVSNINNICLKKQHPKVSTAKRIVEETDGVVGFKDLYGFEKNKAPWGAMENE